MSSIELSRPADASIAPEVLVNLVSMPQALQTISQRALARQGFTLFTVNLDHIVKLGDAGAFRDAYARADFVSADGWPIVWVMKRAGYDVERTAGADLLEPVCRLAADNGMPMYFVGPGPASQAAGLEILGERYPGLRIVGAETPKVTEPPDPVFVAETARRINASGARICVLSLGAPKQELLADALRTRCPDVGFLCVGAALDFISGHAIRAPLWMRRAKLEWFWRMINDPLRLTTRYALCALALGKLVAPGLFPSAPRLRHADRA
jgi:N-acetylglucosaminyldiphosphoundecaprenol N-acetyl-beta-D-mannosaminyltransferase